MTHSKAGQIVWHDLFTSDRKRSMDFYRHIADWTYQVERATDFAWGGGEKDFVLALLDDEAGAGFAETPPEHENGWIAYIEVPDVDAAVKHVDALGGEIVRKPFEVPGGGRNALVRDPLGRKPVAQRLPRRQRFGLFGAVESVWRCNLRDGCRCIRCFIIFVVIVFRDVSTIIVIDL